MKRGACAVSSTNSEYSSNEEDTSDQDATNDEEEEGERSDVEILGQRSFSSSSKAQNTFKKQSNENVLVQEDLKKASLRPVLLKKDATLQLQRSLVAEAFQSDKGLISEEAEFASEKLSIATNETAKPLMDATLVGWGSWGGHGISEDKSKRKRPFLVPNSNVYEREGVDPSKRKDARLPHVIIREKRGSKQAELKYQLDRLPYPYDNETQFNAANYLMPVGKEWNPASILQKKIAPRISQNLNGLVIKPIPLKRKG